MRRPLVPCARGSRASIHPLPSFREFKTMFRDKTMTGLRSELARMNLLNCCSGQLFLLKGKKKQAAFQLQPLNRQLNHSKYITLRLFEMSFIQNIWPDKNVREPFMRLKDCQTTTILWLDSIRSKSNIFYQPHVSHKGDLKSAGHMYRGVSDLPLPILAVPVPCSCGPCSLLPECSARNSSEQ